MCYTAFICYVIFTTGSTGFPFHNFSKSARLHDKIVVAFYFLVICLFQAFLQPVKGFAGYFFGVITDELPADASGCLRFLVSLDERKNLIDHLLAFHFSFPPFTFLFLSCPVPLCHLHSGGTVALLPGDSVRNFVVEYKKLLKKILRGAGV